MIRDPFYREITRRLGETLDPELFERCAADLLSEEWPSLVPIRGGSDFGMDGAVGDGEGPAFPLVSTTSDDVIGNLTCNLTSYVNHGGARRKVILATSRQLTPKRRYNLESRATEKGFTLVHVYDQAAIANRLYRNPKWCRELLNLSGTPPALSRIPLGGRPLLGDTLIGREADFHWIQNKKEDCLIVGQPGSGKTFLLRKLAETDKALFMVSDNREEIATALRELSPPTVIVDDAHGTLDTLLRLRHLREETGISFQIAASAWPGDEERIAEMLNLTEADVRSLELLTRDEIVQVVKLAGIQGPDELIRHIVNQSEGRPGLATTLVHLCLRGDVAQVAVGDALNRSICTTLEKLVGRRAVQMLAAFAFGGDSGMQPMDVAGALGISPLDIQHDLIGLSSGGVILQLRDNALSVRPRDLRYPLLRDVFFSGPAPLPADTLIELTPDKGQLAICLIGTRRVGGNVSSDLLLSILEESQSPKAWAHFASLGQSEARIALRSHPEMFFDIVPAVLHSAPSLVLPILMERAIGDNRQQSSYPEHPLRILHDWIRSAYPSSPGVLIRRTETLGAAAQWLKKGGEENVGMQALAAAFDPYFELNRTDPGGGHTFTITSGSLPVEQIKSITGLWERAVATLSIGSWKECAPLLDMV